MRCSFQIFCRNGDYESCEIGLALSDEDKTVSGSHVNELGRDLRLRPVNGLRRQGKGEGIAQPVFDLVKLNVFKAELHIGLCSVERLLEFRCSQRSEEGELGQMEGRHCVTHEERSVDACADQNFYVD